MTKKRDIWQDVCALATLDTAWARVRSNGGCSGGDGLTVHHYQTDAPRRLDRLARSLLSGDYDPAAIREVNIPKRKGGTRRLLIPSLDDRILHTALSIVLTPLLEPHFEDSSFAYRPGRSVKQAVKAIENWRNQGYWHVIEADIVGYFDAILHDKLLGKLEGLIGHLSGASEVLAAIEYWLACLDHHTGVMGKGVAQGSPLSPLLANLYLDDLDEALHTKGVRIVRFADDFVVLCKKRKTAETALADVTDIIGDHGLNLNPGGTRILDFDKGFRFLGHLFVRSMVLQQISDPEEDVLGALRGVAATDDAASQAVKDLSAEIEKERDKGYDRGDRVLYLTKAGRHLTLQNLSFSVESEAGRSLLLLANHRVDRIEIHPGVLIDQSAIQLAMSCQIQLIFVNGIGEPEGWLEHRRRVYGGLHLLHAEAVFDAQKRLGYAKGLVSARIRNQRTQLFRLNRRQKNADVTIALTQMGRNLRKVDTANSIETLLGYEGVSGALYWPALGALCEAETGIFRRARPANDPLNAAMNYLTGILQRDVRSALLHANLHTGFGVLHSGRDRHEAAVFDFMEPFRAPLTEGLAVYLFNANRLTEDDFLPADTGIRIAYQARRALIEGYEAACKKRVKVTGTSQKLAWRPLMQRQAKDFAKSLRAGDPGLFRPYLMEA